MTAPPVSSGRVFSIILAGLALSTLVGVLHALLHRAVFVESFPGAAAAPVYWSLVLAPGAGLVALGGLWFRRSWAVLLYGVTGVAAVALDYEAAAPAAHMTAAVVAVVIVLALAYSRRSDFR